MWRSERASRFALTMRSGLSVVGGFFLRAILALIPALTVWYLAQEWLIEPVAWLTERTMLYFFPNWVLGAELEGVNLVLLTTIRVPQVSGAIAEFTPDVNVLTYCYGLPMLAALLIGAKARGLWWKLPVGALILIPFQVWGCVFALLVTIGVHFGDLSAHVTGFSAIQLNAFALAYQFGFLVLPTLIPILLWLVMGRAFVTVVLCDAVLHKASR